jgi:hypothetical protein
MNHLMLKPLSKIQVVPLVLISRIEKKSNRISTNKKTITTIEKAIRKSTTETKLQLISSLDSGSNNLDRLQLKEQ